MSLLPPDEGAGSAGHAEARDPVPEPARKAHGAPGEAGGTAGLPEDTSPPGWTYESASARLDEIVRRLDSGEAGLRETLELCQEARGLVEFCAGELDAVGRGLEELRLEDLVARLEESPARG